MLCYKDKTFCEDWSLCKKGTGCERAITDEVMYGADARGLPICCVKQFDCFEKKETEEKK